MFERGDLSLRQLKADRFFKLVPQYLGDAFGRLRVSVLRGIGGTTTAVACLTYTAHQ